MKRYFRLLVTISLFLGICLLPVVSQETEGDSWEEMIGIKVQEINGGKVNIIIATTGPVKYHPFPVHDPERLVMEMVNTLHNWSQRDIEVGHPILKRVRSAQFANEPVKITRVVLDLEQPIYYNATSTQKQIILTVSSKKEQVGVTEVKAKEAKTEIKQEVAKKPVPESRITKRPVSRNIEDEEHRRMVAKVQREEKQRSRERISQRAKAVEVKDEIKTVKKEVDIIRGGIVTSISKKKVSFDFNNADLAEVIRALSLQTGKNMVLAEGVSGTVNLHLRDVPFDEAFRMILDQKGLIAIQQSKNLIWIVDKSKMPIQVKTFTLTSRKASDLQSTLSSLLTEEEKKYSKITVDGATNSLVVSTTPEGMEKIERLIDTFDMRSPQIKIACKIMEVKLEDNMELGINWQAKKTFSDQVGSLYDAQTGQKNVHTVEDVDVTGDFIFPLGDTFDTTTNLNISTIMDDLTLNATLSAIQQNIDNNVLSAPTLVVENNESASIHVGETIPYTKTTTDPSGTQTTTMGTVEVGVSMNITPAVSPGGDQITLDVSVHIKDIIPPILAAGPRTYDRSADSKITIKHGNTVVIGGLIKEDDKETVQKVPLLGDIPILGYLFKNKSVRKARTEVLIFLSPEIL